MKPVIPELVQQASTTKSAVNSAAALLNRESPADCHLPQDELHQNGHSMLGTELVEKPEPDRGLDDDSSNGSRIVVPDRVEPLSDCKRRNSCRTDSGKLHRTQHGILSREVLAGLVQLGEDPRTFRRLERQYRAALRPVGLLGSLFFDRFWSSYMRLMLIGRLESGLIRGKSAGKRKLAGFALVPGEQPTLVCQDLNSEPSEATPLMDELPPDLLHRLVLVQRYDRHNSREMYRALGLLLLLRRGGEAALEGWATEMLGGRPRQED